MLENVLWSVYHILIFLKLTILNCSSGVHFRLQTLYCCDPQSFDISRIFKSQIELQIFGVYDLNIPHAFLETLKQFHRDDAQLFTPMVFILEGTYLNAKHWHVYIFPGLYTVDRIATIHRVLVESMDKDLTSESRIVDMNKVSMFSIYLFDCSNVSTIHALVKDMTVIFSQITVLNLFFAHQCEIVSFLSIDG